MPKSKQLEMLDKLSNILAVLPITRSIREINKLTNIPQTTISNYLHNKILISELLGLDEIEEDYQELFILIDKWLKRAKLEGPYKGVEVINTRYGYSQSRGKGKYKGTRKR